MAEKGLKKWVITLTVITAALLELIDTTIVNVSLPQIQGNLGATLEDIAWITTGYAVANVIILPMSGWLGETFGRKNYFIFSIVIFTIASFLCGNSTTLEELIMFRILQGLAGGGLISTGQAILLETWPPEEVGIATAMFGLGAVVGPTLGPTIGGYITEHFSWPFIFYVNIPIGIIATFAAYLVIRETPKAPKGRPIDWWGIILLALTVGSLQTVLEKGESEDWFAASYILVLTVVAVLGFFLFIWREKSIEYPIVNLNILKKRSFSVGMFFSFILGFGLYGSVFIFPIFAQNLLGFSALQTGEIFLPGGLATIVLMPLIGIMLKKGVPAQLMAAFGMLLFFLFSFMLSKSTLSSGTGDFFWPLILRGVGMAFLFVPLTTLAIQDLRGREIGQGTGLNNMGRQLGGSFGIAALTTMIHLRNGVHRSNLLSNINEYNTAFTQKMEMIIRSFMAKGYTYLDAQHAAAKAIEGMVTRQTFLLTYTDAYWVVGFVMLFSIPLLALQKFKKNTNIPVDAH
ncbi:MAG: DHA2 family efflux MFS transporter permease subunit [Bacteroidetes bacterium]|nr:DHA2 family efflux MFS transporter permease subunit [Bacteroidota bacterium]MBU1373442.1 DHA2 family efflux MFS transporter permease subunit [Bacteroidota bacterium]MBU1485200.1 DHA2 family efflux MFS transporter permease subunit [Bacteroidota bacterium]MBU1761424.1 DHA2 family efflux MFS transporter permease subunit [Bacteroidota bacterium]MBU2046932.1 DHA2 family efflux MFS transporter permease subunit [Bacteroidota bacterium]